MPTNTQTLSLPETNLKDYWDILVRRRWIIFAFCLVCTIGAGIFSFLMTPLYRASATIVVEGENSDVLNPNSSTEKGMSFDIFENYLQTQMSLILSRNVAGRVFDDLGLIADPRYQSEPDPVKKYFSKKRSELFSMLGLENKKSGHKADPLNYFLKDIELERLKGTRAIRISVMHPDAEMAARIANALAERYSRDNLMRRAMTFIRNQRMASLNADYLRLQSKYDALSNQYGPKHYEMIMLKNEIRALAKSIQSEQARNQQAETSTESPFGNVTKEEEERLLGDILSKIQESSVMSSSQMNNIAIADPAVPPTQVAVPHKAKNILVAFFVSMIAGMFLAFFVEYLDDTIKNEHDLKKLVGGANFMGAIPYEERAKGFRRVSKVDSLVALKPLSGSAEAYRLIRIQLYWFIKKKPDFKDFAIVSSLPDEGKSTMASNMALALAQLNQKVLLVDADIRRGRLSRTYSAGKKKGLTQYLTDDVELSEVVQRTKVPNLWVVTAGENVMKGSELFSSPRMEQFIQESRANFDIIVYDTPPITLIADTAVLLSQLHGAILVTRTRVTRSRIVPKAVNMIRETNTNFIGVVLNSTDAIESKYYHRYYKD
jgi:polysaccharide biosynthesis transport protein